MKILKKIGCIGLSVAMLCTVGPFSFAGGSVLGSVELSPATQNVEVDGTASKTVEVSLMANGGDTEYYSVCGNFSTQNTETDKYLTLTDISSTVLSFTGINEKVVEEGKIMWSDSSLENPITPVANTALATATYTVDKDAPTGDYTVKYTSSSLTGSDGDPVATKQVYTATIHVDGVCDHSDAVEHEATAATCTTAGDSAYWSCPDCNKYFSDEECTTEIAENSWVGKVPALGHNYVDGVCTRCGAEQPSNCLYWAIDEVTTSSAKANANAEIKAKIMVSTSSESVVFAGCDIDATYDASKLEISGTPTAKLAGLTIGTGTSGQIDIWGVIQATKQIELKSDTPQVLAEVTFTTKPEFSGEAQLGFTKKDLAMEGSAEGVEVKTDAASTGGVEKIVANTVKISQKDGDETLKDNEEMTTGAELDLGTRPDQEGMKFLGWDTDASADEVVAVGKITVPESDTTYYAVYEAKSVKITLIDAAGSREIAGTYKTAIPEGTFDPAAKTGYTFDGWYDENDSKLEVTLSTYPAADVTYTAKYTADSYTLTYDAANGISVENGSYTIESDSVLPATTRNGYTFIGWKATAVDSEGSSWTLDTVYPAGKALKGQYGNVSLTAQWQLNATFEFEDYTYAKTGDVMLIVSDVLAPEAINAGKSYKFDGNQMYKISGEAYYKNGATVYVTIVNYSTYKNMTQAELVALLTADGVENAEITAANRGNLTVDVNNSIDIFDASGMYQILALDKDYNADLYGIQGRLQADASTSTYGASDRGSIADVNKVLDKIAEEQ